MNPDRWFWIIAPAAFTVALYFFWIAMDFIRGKESPGKISDSLYLCMVWSGAASLWVIPSLLWKATGRTLDSGKGAVVNVIGAVAFFAVLLFEKGWSRLDPLPVAIRAAVYSFLGLWVWAIDRLLLKAWGF